jgi:hypothetical protein
MLNEDLFYQKGNFYDNYRTVFVTNCFPLLNEIFLNNI